jgi:hypothetical protein
LGDNSKINPTQKLGLAGQAFGPHDDKSFMLKSLFISLLPRFMRHAFYRNKYARVPTSVPEGLTFELARTQEDIEAAFKLLHDTYVEEGFIETQQSGMRVIVQHALPSTSLLVAKLKGRVIGTISVIRDTPIGLPMEKAFNISHLKSHGRRVSELSGLAIHPDFRRNKGENIFFPLTLFATTHAQNSCGTDILVWTLYPKQADFYNGIFGSKHLGFEIKNYLGAPAVAIVLNPRSAYEFFKRKYHGKSSEKDLFQYTFVDEHAYFKYPKKVDGVINHPVMTPEMFRYFFVTKTNIMNYMTLLEEQVVGRYYPLASYAKVIPYKMKSSEIKQRMSERWDIRIDAECVRADKETRIKATLLDISVTGFRVLLTESIPLHENHCFEIRLMDGSVAKISAKGVWKNKDEVYGFSIIKADENWDKLVEIQSRGLHSIAS